MYIYSINIYSRSLKQFTWNVDQNQPALTCVDRHLHFIMHDLRLDIDIKTVVADD